MASTEETDKRLTSQEVQDILDQAKQSTADAKMAQAQAEKTMKNIQEAAEARQATYDKIQSVVAKNSSFDAKWEEFKRKFDDLSKLAVERLSGVMGVSDSSKLRPVEVISESRLAQILHKSKNVVVLTGAGISAESGIPTFRGSDGYWTVGSENYRPQELATWEKFDEMPDELWKWYQYRWGVCRSAKPNAGHHALVELEQMLGDNFRLATQNIDALHIQAGSDPARICEIHGRIEHMRCDERVAGSCLHGLDLTDPLNFEAAWSCMEKTPQPHQDESLEQLPHCKRCGVRQRPKILWFDECYNEAIYRSKTASEAAANCDVLLVVGTQLTTGLPSSMVSAARKAGAIIVRLDALLDLEDHKFNGMLHIRGKSGEVLPRVLQELHALRQEALPAPLEPSADLSKAPVSTPTLLAAAAKAASKASKGKSSLRAAGSLSVAAGSPSAAIKQQKAKVSAVTPPKSQALTALGFFVYGTLRPDDDSGAAWTKDFNENMSAQAASLEGASLYADGHFPAVCLERTRCAVRGVLLTPQNQDAGLMAAKLKEADRIEGYPDLYGRSVCLVKTAGGKTVPAYVYHKTGRLDREQSKCIADGDWLSRKR